MEQFKKRKKSYHAVENGKVMLWQVKKTLHFHFPDLQGEFSTLSDPRTGIQYQIEELVMASFVLFLLNSDSRNDFNNKSNNEQFRRNYYRIFRLELPHMDAVNNLFKKLSAQELELIRCRLIASLIEKRVFHKFRFFDARFYIAIDATGVYNWGDNPPDDIRKHALKKEFGKDKDSEKEEKKVKINYSSHVFEAVLVFKNGMVIPLMSEWIANTDTNYVKQDCEMNAFKRLSVRLKECFPRLPVCILADGLYSNVSMMDICRQYDWKYITVFKDTILSTVWEEVESLLPLKDGCFSKEQLVYEAGWWITRRYRWIKDIEYQKHCIHWVECVQERVHKTTGETQTNRFVFLTNQDVNHSNIAHILTAARARWLIEDHFNTQKNREGALHHKFNRNSFNAVKCWHSVRQLAFLIKELAVHTAEFMQLKKENGKMTYKQLWKDLNAYLALCPVEAEMQEFETWSNAPRQIRLE